MLKTGVKERWTDIIDKSPVLITQERLELNPPRVDIDNETSPDCTILEVRAPDRPGLLSEIGGVLDQFSLNIDLAFIATESYQLVDVFYVTDLEANKITDKRRLDDIRDALMERIEARIAEVRPKS